jgi:hypothetical protein
LTRTLTLNNHNRYDFTMSDARNQQSENFRQAMRDLFHSGVTDLVYTKVHDATTGETSYIEGNGNTVSQAQVDAQNAARTALTMMPEIDAEKILATEADDEMGGLDSNDDPNASPTTINLIHDDTESKKDGTEDETEPNESSEDDESEGHVSGIGQKGGETPSTPQNRPMPQASHRSKRWSEIKSWQKITTAEGAKECPEDIDRLVADTEATAGKPLKKSYRDRVTELKAIGYNVKASQLTDAKQENLRLQQQLARARAQVKKYKADNTKLRATIVTTGDKGKGENAAMPTPIPTTKLNLPPPPQSRLTLTAPTSAIAFAALPDTIIDSGIGMIRATGEKDWPERARNWVVAAESRPRLEYK